MARIIFFLLIGSLIISCSQTSITVIGNIDENTNITETGNLLEILGSHEIPVEYILVIAADGTAFFIAEKSISELELVKVNGRFQTKTTTLPPVCNLNNISEICVYNSDYPMTNHETAFSIKMSEFELLGENSKDGHYVRKYKRGDK